jgi:hypothetical protein
MSGYGVKHYDAFATNLKGNTQGALSVSATGAQTSPFSSGSDGVYDLWSDVDVWVKVSSGTASDVTSSTGYHIAANTKIPVKFDDGDRLGAIASSAGTLRYHRVS